MIKKLSIVVLALAVALAISYIVFMQSKSMHEAAEKGDIAEIQRLLKLGAKVDKLDKDGWTALMVASQNGHTEIVKLLLQSKANVNIQNKYSWTALMIATNNGHIETVKALVGAGADINAQDKENGKTALDYAKQKKYRDIVAILRSSAKQAPDKSELSASAKQVPDKSASLMPSQANSRESTASYNEQLLILASSDNHKEIRKLILMHEANINYKDPSTGETPLMKALLAKQFETAKLLVRLGSNVNASSRDKTTPLHIAARQGHLESIQILIDNGAKQDALDNNNQTAFNIAKKYKYTKITNFLKGKEISKDYTKELLAF